MKKWKKRKNWRSCSGGVNGRSRNFHVPTKLEIANFNSQQKVQEWSSWWMEGIDGAVSSH